MASKPGSLPNPGISMDENLHRPCGVRCTGGVTFIQAFVWNLGTCLVMLRETAQGQQAEAKIPMHQSGSDRFIVVMKPL